jgi:uncharacterized phage-associated protein
MMVSKKREARIGKVRFRFDAEKFADAMAYLAARVRDLTPMKAVKLLYFADRRHLHAHGRPILGDAYACLPHGPVPSVAYDVLKDVGQGRRGDEQDYPREAAILSAHVRVDKSGTYPRFVAKKGLVLDALAAAELETLRATVSTYGRLSAGRLRNLSHAHAAWKDCNEAQEHWIDYEAFFKDAPPKAASRLELMRLEQDARELGRSIR